MIERISGKLIEKSPAFSVIDFHGMGLGVFTSTSTFEKLGDLQETVHLYTYLHVREDMLQLYGFADTRERALFLKLLGVGGVGPRLALTILSGLTPMQLSLAIASEDAQLLTGISGVGKKTAQRIILELKEKIKVELEEQSEKPAISILRPNETEAVQALVALGYKYPDARKTIEKLQKGDGAERSVEELIKQALREI